MTSLTWFSRADVVRALPMAQAVDLMAEAFTQLSTGKAVVPVRMNVALPQQNGEILFMPVCLTQPAQLGVKAVSIFGDNPARGLPLIYALVTLFDGETGRPVAVMDGEYLTALRTGAASGLATRLLSREDSRTVALFGAGAQAKTQLEAVAAVRDIREVYVFNRDLAKCEVFCREMSTALNCRVVPAPSREVLADADIICTATTAVDPLFGDVDLKAGVHINAVGAYRPDMREVPGETIARARVVVDHRESCLAEAGDLLIPIGEGRIDPSHIHAEIGEICAGLKPGRDSEGQITVFKSVGNAVQDLAAASQVLANGHAAGLGTLLPT